MSSASTLCTPENVAEWRATLPSSATVGLLIDTRAQSTCRTSCDYVVATTPHKSVDIVVNVPHDFEERELWVEGDKSAKTTAMLLLSWIRPTHVFLRAQHSLVDVYKQLVADFWFDTTIRAVDVVEA